MTGKKETVKYFTDGTENVVAASLSEDSKEVLLWAAEGGQSEMQATVWLDKQNAIALAHHILELAFKIKK